METAEQRGFEWRRNEILQERDRCWEAGADLGGGRWVSLGRDFDDAISAARSLLFARVYLFARVCTLPGQKANLGLSIFR